MPDFDVTIVYEGNIETQEWLYYEQDGTVSYTHLDVYKRQEYGAEIEAETSEKDPSELKYITPIDYAKRIAELDEDLRDAAEILVTDCSCYTPFRAFLMDCLLYTSCFL